MKVIIDRIEENFLIIELENGTFLELPKEIIPFAKEGDVIKIEIDSKETMKRKEKIQDLMNQAFED